MVFRARIASTPNASSAEIINYLKQWVMTGRAGILLFNIRLDIEPECEVEISSFDDSLCKLPTTIVENVEPQSSDVTEIIYPLVGAIAGAVVVIIVVICALHIFCSIRRRSHKYDLRLVNQGYWHVMRVVDAECMFLCYLRGIMHLLLQLRCTYQHQRYTYQHEE